MALPTLLALSKDSDPAVRRVIATAFGTMRRQRPVALTALATLLRDPERLVRINAANAIGQLYDPAGEAPLLAALDDPDSEVRYFAIVALAIVGSPAALPALEAIQKFAATTPITDSIVRETARTIELITLRHSRSSS